MTATRESALSDAGDLARATAHDTDPRTADGVAQMDADHIWHPYTRHLGMRPPPEIVRARGASLYDVDGREILDMISSWWVTLHGHAEPTIAAAIARQAETLEQVIFAGFTHEPAARFASELSDVLPTGLTRIFFSDDGSTAVEAALKMALQYWANRGEKRRTIVALENAYHGDTFGAMSVSARGVFTKPFRDHLFDIELLPDPTGHDTLSALEQLLRRRKSEIAAIIVEPMLQGSGGMKMWDAEILRALRERADAARILFIADEVLTGFGRTGPLFACEHADVSPDIMCLSKGITGGFVPLGATAVTKEIFDTFSIEGENGTLFHGHSYTANPLACAAGRASLKLLDATSAARRTAIEKIHNERIAKLARNSDVKNPRVLGTVAALDIGDGASYLNPIGKRLAAFALERGVLLRPLGNVVYLLPPYCTTAEQLDTAYNVIETFLGAEC
jgi:adenosylmethionine---8-amino-7-oxononanoate aminotransferase